MNHFYVLYNPINFTVASTNIIPFVLEWFWFQNLHSRVKLLLSLAILENWFSMEIWEQGLKPRCFLSQMTVITIILTSVYLSPTEQLQLQIWITVHLRRVYNTLFIPCLPNKIKFDSSGKTKRPNIFEITEILREESSCYYPKTTAWLRHSSDFPHFE